MSNPRLTWPSAWRLGQQQRRHDQERGRDRELRRHQRAAAAAARRGWPSTSGRRERSVSSIGAPLPCSEGTSPKSSVLAAVRPQRHHRTAPSRPELLHARNVAGTDPAQHSDSHEGQHDPDQRGPECEQGAFGQEESRDASAREAPRAARTASSRRRLVARATREVLTRSRRR